MLLKRSQHSGGQGNNTIDIGIEPGNYRIQLWFLQGLVQVFPDTGSRKKITSLRAIEISEDFGVFLKNPAFHSLFFQ